MHTQHAKDILYGVLFLGGIACLAVAFHQQRYTHLIAAGNRAVAEKRFDTQDYDHAGRFWLARADILLFNQGVLAYKARNVPRAAEHFRRVLQLAQGPPLKMQAFYNLGRVLLDIEEVEGAAELFKAALRLDPLDQEAKFQLERLYHFALRQEGKGGEASLKQAPGVGQEEPKGSDGTGQGRSTPHSGI